MSSPTFQIIRGTALLMLFAAAAAWFLWRWLKGSRDPAALLFRWILTGVAFFGLWCAGVQGQKDIQSGSPAAILVVIYACLGGLFLAIVWVPVLIDFVSRKIGSLYDGGDSEIEPKAMYSIFHAKKTKGKYFEALAEVRKQLDKFPHDFEGHINLAELQAEHLNDLPGAEVTIHRLCGQPGHAPANIAFALNKLADWHLGLVKDRDGAKAALQKIIELLPDTEQSLQASQRIARLAETGALLAPHERRKVVVKKGVDNIGLLLAQDHLKPAEADPAHAAGEFVKHLEQHPLDTHAREKLAVIYAGHYHRLDLALDQLEQLVQQPNHPAKQIVHWINLMADLQIQENAPVETVRETLQRIVDGYPGLPAAEKAQRRMDTVKLEFRVKEQGHQVQLGAYEQNIGLKRNA